jgi:uncharacterized protein (TIGR02117 family)
MHCGRAVFKIVVMLAGIFLLMITGGHFLSVPPLTYVSNNSEACRDSVEIYVLDNGIHASIVVPVQNGGLDWSEFIALDSVSRRGSPPYHYLEFGWGEKRFYINTPEWRDLRMRILIPALFWPTSSVMHVTGLRRAPSARKNESVKLDACSYANLVNFIQGSFVKEDGQKVFVADGYYNDDGFFKAHGRYHLFNTCNNWVAQGLQEAGISTPLWPLFPPSILRHTRKHQ